MGRKHKRGNPFAARKREMKQVNSAKNNPRTTYRLCFLFLTWTGFFAHQGLKTRPDKRTEPYQDIIRENDIFVKYYKVKYIYTFSKQRAIKTAARFVFRINKSVRPTSSMPFSRPFVPICQQHFGSPHIEAKPNVC